jgi:hypothetical protein
MMILICGADKASVPGSYLFFEHRHSDKRCAKAVGVTQPGWRVAAIGRRHVMQMHQFSALPR